MSTSMLFFVLAVVAGVVSGADSYLTVTYPYPNLNSTVLPNSMVPLNENVLYDYSMLMSNLAKSSAIVHTADNKDFIVYAEFNNIYYRNVYDAEPTKWSSLHYTKTCTVLNAGVAGGSIAALFECKSNSKRWSSPSAIRSTSSDSSDSPTNSPSNSPSSSPSDSPTNSPSNSPSSSPSSAPSDNPTGSPSGSPTGGPTSGPSAGRSLHAFGDHFSGSTSTSCEGPAATNFARTAVGACQKSSTTSSLAIYQSGLVNPTYVQKDGFFLGANAVAYSANGVLANMIDSASGNCQMLYFRNDGTEQVVSESSFAAPANQYAYSIAVTPNGATAVVSSAPQNTLIIYTLSSGSYTKSATIVAPTGFTSLGYSVAISDDGKVVWAAARKGTSERRVVMIFSLENQAWQIDEVVDMGGDAELTVSGGGSQYSFAINAKAAIAQGYTAILWVIRVSEVGAPPANVTFKSYTTVQADIIVGVTKPGKFIAGYELTMTDSKNNKMTVNITAQNSNDQVYSWKCPPLDTTVTLKMRTLSKYGQYSDYTTTSRVVPSLDSIQTVLIEYATCFVSCFAALCNYDPCNNLKYSETYVTALEHPDVNAYLSDDGKQICAMGTCTPIAKGASVTGKRTGGNIMESNWIEESHVYVKNPSAGADYRKLKCGSSSSGLSSAASGPSDSSGSVSATVGAGIFVFGLLLLLL